MYDVGLCCHDKTTCIAARWPSLKTENIQTIYKYTEYEIKDLSGCSRRTPFVKGSPASTESLPRLLYIEWSVRNSLGINENLYFMLLYMYTVLYKTAVQIPKIDLLELSVLLDCSSKED